MRRMYEAHCAKQAWKLFRENNNLSVETLTELCYILDTFFDQSDEDINKAMEREFRTEQPKNTNNSLATAMETISKLVSENERLKREIDRLDKVIYNHIEKALKLIQENI